MSIHPIVSKSDLFVFKSKFIWQNMLLSWKSNVLTKFLPVNNTQRQLHTSQTITLIYYTLNADTNNFDVQFFYRFKFLFPSITKPYGTEIKFCALKTKWFLFFFFSRLSMKIWIVYYCTNAAVAQHLNVKNYWLEFMGFSFI